MSKIEETALALINDVKEQVQKLIEYGHTESFVQEFLNLSPSQWRLVKREIPDFASALKKWKLVADEKVESALYERAIGYSYPDIDVKVTKEGDVIKTPIVKRFPPDVNAAIFWLKNRKPNEWKEKVDVAVQGEVHHKHLHLVSEVDINDRIEIIAKENLSKDAIDALS